MADIKFSCPHCGQYLEAPPDMAGTEIACPTCSKSITISAQQKDERASAYIPPLDLRIAAPSAGSGLARSAGGFAESSARAAKVTAWLSLGVALLGWSSSFLLRPILFLLAAGGAGVGIVLLAKRGNRSSLYAVPIIAMCFAWLGLVAIPFGWMVSVISNVSSASASKQVGISPAKKLLGHWVNDSYEELYYSSQFLIFPESYGHEPIYLQYRIVNEDFQNRFLRIDVETAYGHVWKRRDIQFSEDYKTLKQTCYEPGIDIGIDEILHYVDSETP